ncbi:MAG TPA: NAD(P)H-dependent glycerol-3-phosphate dehydrogenase [Bacilli bacterium]|nr:NAD(P)H-dependent glycerol-3-phosphate dehydrogenase [Bacilli bacterium]HQD92232.1 NAD(P)H-dependent glycerol-3-phosphate dehydrogenase [Bacilli bacterium]
MMKERIAIIGAGSWGSALARIISDNGYEVKLFDVDENIVNEINQFHTNKSKLPVGTLNENVTATTNLKEAIAFGDLIVLAVPTAVIRGVLANINKVIESPKIFVNASKGIEPNTYKRVSEITKEEVDAKYIKGFVALTGPSHAEEVIQQMLTVVTAASDDMEIAKKVQEIFSNQTYFRVYRLNDLIGAELGGSLKNIIALASGILEGLGYGDNTKAALITRGLVEMRRLAVAMGAKEETLFGLTGLGDLVVTAMSKHSRNFQAGYKIGSGKDLEKALSEMTMVVEGARSCISAYQASRELGIETPIIDAVYDIIYNKVDPRERILELMKRTLKEE